MMLRVRQQAARVRVGDEEEQVMTSGTTRSRVRWQVREADADLRRAEKHLTQLAALADDRSGYINDNLPQIIAGLHLIIETVESFYEGL